MKEYKPLIEKIETAIAETPSKIHLTISDFNKKHHSELLKGIEQEIETEVNRRYGNVFKDSSMLEGLEVIAETIVNKFFHPLFIETESNLSAFKELSGLESEIETALNALVNKSAIEEQKALIASCEAELNELKKARDTRINELLKEKERLNDMKNGLKAPEIKLLKRRCESLERQRRKIMKRLNKYEAIYEKAHPEEYFSDLFNHKTHVPFAQILGGRHVQKYAR